MVALQPVAVHSWPQCMQRAVDELHASHALSVIRIASPATTNRLLARELIRTALRETLAVFLQQPAASIRLVSHPGQAICLDSPLARLYISVSHMPGMSVAAIAKGTAVGVDLMPIHQGTVEMPDWERVAMDYLGPVATVLLQRTLAAQRAAVFAQSWTHFEASLKCLGLPLTEWTPALAQQLATCRVMALDLPQNCRGAIAVNQAHAGGMAC